MTKVIGATFEQFQSLEASSLFRQGNYDQIFYGHGKLLLSGEYFVLHGACSLAVPVKLGQYLGVRFRPSFTPRLHWKSYDCQGEVWFEGIFDFWHFDCLQLIKGHKEVAHLLKKILSAARGQNRHFLREGHDVKVETFLEFPLDWGLGSSSTLMYIVAQWAYVSPFELLRKTLGGSGYDVACSQSEGPLVYLLEGNGPSWTQVHFHPDFSNQLYFVYLGRKQNSRQAVRDFKKLNYPSSLIEDISNITLGMIQSKKRSEFDHFIRLSENLISTTLGLETVKSGRFSDFEGEIKSLGAWGGDFALVSTDQCIEKVRNYFLAKGHNILIPYDQLVLNGRSKSKNLEASSFIFPENFNRSTGRGASQL